MKPDRNELKLKVAEIFESIDGEVNGWSGPGEWSTFIRLAGCNLNCTFCDTPCARDGQTFTEMTIGEILHDVKDANKITLTGGEPLHQENIEDLIRVLISNCLRVTLETNGSYPIREFHSPEEEIEGPDLRIIMDYKLPSSGQEEFMRTDQLTYLCRYDVLKFVIADQKDFERALQILKEFPTNAYIAFSPAYPTGLLTPKDLVDLIRTEKATGKVPKNVNINLQTHKLIGVA